MEGTVRSIVEAQLRSGLGQGSARELAECMGMECGLTPQQQQQLKEEQTKVLAELDRLRAIVESGR